MADNAPDSSKLLEEIRREVVESRNMTIKTDNALKTLHAELKVVTAQQDAFQKRTWFSTGAVYILFAGLCVAGVVVISNARAASANAERERLEKQVGELNVTIDKLKAEIAGQQAAEQSALQVYRQMTTLPGEERLKGIDALSKIDQTRLAPFAKLVLQDRAISLRKEVGGAVLEKGKSAFRRQDWAETISQLNRFMTMDPVPEDALDASFYLGNAYFQSRKFEDAIKHLTRFTDGDKKAKLRDFALMMLMQSYDMTGNRDLAVATAKEGYSTYPSSDFRMQFVSRLQRTVPGAAAPAAPAPAAPAPTPAPAPTR
jgi:TolA-binding protein